MVSADEIIKLIKQGKTQTEIAKELGLSNRVIWYRIQKMRERGIEAPNVRRPRKTENDEKDDKILEGLAEGKTQTEIAKELGLSNSVISYRIQKMEERGIEVPKDRINNKILEGLAEGKTQADISKELGLSNQVIWYRIQKMKERGIEVPKVDRINNKILEGLAEGKTQTKIAEELNLSRQRVSQRKHEMIKRDNKKLASMIVNLINTKHATIEQIKIMGEYYGVNVEEVLNSLEEQER